MIIQHSILPAVILWFGVVIYDFFKHGVWKFNKFKFSARHYYIMMSPLLVGLAINSWLSQSWHLVVLFGVFAVTGVIGETLADLWWQKFYSRSLWVYKVEVVYHRYTSWLNFLPWALGGSLYMIVAGRIAGERTFPLILPISVTLLVSSVLLQFLLFNLLKPTNHFKFHQASWISLIVVYLPIVFSIVILAGIYGLVIYHLAFWFAVVGTIAEYLFGKACSFFISKKLWDYTYGAVDDGHFTLLSVPLFCIGGFYFWIISLVVQQYFK